MSSEEYIIKNLIEGASKLLTIEIEEIKLVYTRKEDGKRFLHTYKRKELPEDSCHLQCCLRPD